MSDQLKIALIQMKIKPGNLAANLARAESLTNKAAMDHPHLILLPEMFATGFHYTSLREMARETPRVLTHMKKLAKEMNVSFIFSLPEEKGGGIFNTAYVIGENGRIKGTYSKIHLFGLFREDKYFSRGTQTSLFRVKKFKVAPLVCYDLRFPELARNVTLKGAHLIVYVSQWPKERIPHWKILLAARAVENQLYVAAVNGAGTSGQVCLGGNSMVVAPYGDVVARGGSKEEVVIAELDFTKIREFREMMPCLKDRYPKAY